MLDYFQILGKPETTLKQYSEMLLQHQQLQSAGMTEMLSWKMFWYSRYSVTPVSVRPQINTKLIQEFKITFPAH